MGIAASAARTELLFDGKSVDSEQLGVAASAQMLVTPRLTVSALGGAVLGGKLSPAGDAPDAGPAGPGDADIEPGALAGASVAYVPYRAQDGGAFVLTSLGFAISFVKTRNTDTGETSDFSGRDLRLGGAFGWALAHASPYVAARGFVGGAQWNGVTGRDKFLYQAGVGVSVHLPRRFDLVAELMPLGEKVATVGVGWSF